MIAKFFIILMFVWSVSLGRQLTNIYIKKQIKNVKIKFEKKGKNGQLTKCYINLLFNLFFYDFFSVWFVTTTKM